MLTVENLDNSEEYKKENVILTLPFITKINILS